MSRGALEGERTLSMPVPAVNLQRGASGWSTANGWTGTGANDLIMFEAYFDTSGYTSDDMTLFPVSSLLQDPGRYISSNNAVPLQVLDIISQVRLSMTDVYSWVYPDPTIQGSNAMPGMIGTDVDWTQIVWGQYRTFLPQNSFIGFGTEMLVASGGMFGSGSPSTAQKLYCYRFILLPGSQDADTLQLPASRFVLNAVIAPEDDKAFLMRQKRSYELAT
jgi:hypothetical protein